MDKNQNLYDQYLSSYFTFSIDMSEPRLKLEFSQFDKNVGNLLPVNKDCKILDIGFGTGYFIKYLLEKGYKNIKGIEVSKEMVDYVKKNIHKNVEHTRDTEKFLKDHANTYDVICMFDVLEHIPKSETIRMLKIIKQSLKKDGIFIARVPNAANPLNVQIFYHDFTHEVFFTSASLLFVLKNAGFNEPKVFAWQEQSDSLRSRVLSFVAPVSYSLMRLIIGLNRNYYDSEMPLSRNIYGVGMKVE